MIVRSRYIDTSKPLTLPFVKNRPLFFLVALAVLCCVLPAGVQAQQTASQLYDDAVQAYQAGDMAEAKRKLQLTLEVDKNFRPASALLGRINLEQQKPAAPGQAAAAPVPVRLLQTMAFPVEFKDTTLSTALEYIRQQVEQTSGGKAQINFVLQLPPELANKKVTLRLNHVPVMDVLHYLGDLAGVKFQVQPYAIAVVPLAAGASPHP